MLKIKRSLLACCLIYLCLSSNSLLAQWKGNGPYGGTMLSSVQVGNDIFIGSSGGVYRSADGGLTYTIRSTNLAAGNIKQLFFDGTTMYAGTAAGIYISADTGITWSSSGNGMDFPYNSDYPFVIVNDRVYCYNIQDAYYTTDHGKYWYRRMLPANMQGYGLDFFCAGNILFKRAVGTHCLYRSVNGGDSWIIADSGINEMEVLNIYEINDTFYLFNKSRVYTSVDKGAHWNGMTSRPYSPAGFYFSPGKMCYNGRKFFAAVTNGNNYVFSISPGDTQWVTTKQIPPTGATTLLFNYGSKVYLGRQNHFYSTFDEGATWEEPTEMNIPAMNMATVLAFGQKIFSLYSGVAYESDDNGSGWHKSVSQPPGVVFTISRYNDKLLAGTSEGIFQSADTGKIWENYGLNGIGVSVSCLVNNTLIQYAGCNAKIYQSTNGGDNWYEYNTGLPASISIRDILIFGNSVYIATGFKNGVFSSLNSSDNWLECDQGLPNSVCTALAERKNILYVGTMDFGVYKSTDFGETWTQESAGMGNCRVGDLMLVGNELYAATNAGVFVWNDGSDRWMNISYNLPSRDIRMLSSNAGSIYAAAYGAGIWQITLKTLGTGKVEGLFPGFEIYPNPVNHQLEIVNKEFREGDIILITDCRGLFLERRLVGKEAESDHFLFPVSHLANGVYFIRLITNRNVISRKFVIMH